MATAATGTLMRKMDPHQKWLRRKPPVTGPMATPTPVTPAQMAMAFGRSSGENTFVRMESVAVTTSAPPSPIRARVA